MKKFEQHREPTIRTMRRVRRFVKNSSGIGAERKGFFGWATLPMKNCHKGDLFCLGDCVSLPANLLRLRTTQTNSRIAPEAHTNTNTSHTLTHTNLTLTKTHTHTQTHTHRHSPKTCARCNPVCINIIVAGCFIVVAWLGPT